MALKKTIKASDFEALDDAMKGLYNKTSEDRYDLQVEGDDTADRLKEFRNKNNELMKAQKELEAKLSAFDGVDLDEYKKAMKKAQELRDKKLIDEGKIEELLGQRTERMKADYEGRLKVLQEENQSEKKTVKKLRERLNQEVLDARLSRALSEVGTVRKGAMEDLLSRGRRTWRLDEDSTPVPYDSEDNVIYGSDAKTMMTPLEWAQKQAQDASWFFEDTNGAGGQGNNSQGARNTSSKILDASDKRAIGANLKEVAGGKVKVNMRG